MAEERKLRMGMVGGGPGAFIGPVHRIAAELDGKIELVAGAFSQSAERSREAGASFRIDPARAYADYRQMIEAEQQARGWNRLCRDRDAEPSASARGAGCAGSGYSGDERQAGDGDLRRGAEA